jgi:transposase-like protein
VGRKYGVSDNAIRKWIRFHKREQQRLEREVVQDGEQGGA